MICNLCNTENSANANYCVTCGNNLQAKSVPLNNRQMNSPIIQHQPVQFKVQHKLLSWVRTYKVSDMNDNEFMIIERNFTSFFAPQFNIRRPNGEPLGIIEGNFFRTEWRIIDPSGQIHATIYFPFFMFLSKSFRIETAHGTFTSGNSIFGYNFDVYTPQGQITFTVDKQVLSIRDAFLVKSDGYLSPFITCSAAVCIDQKFYSR